MNQYFSTRKCRCRWQFLLQAFGFSQEAQNICCSYCDDGINQEK
nr:hypothetical protein [Okeania sp. SIO2F4]